VSLQNNVVAVRHMKNYAIVAACGVNNHVLSRSDLFTCYAVVCKEKWPKFLVI
jgi:hypothetical protein